jgi:hypothetical protein
MRHSSDSRICGDTRQACTLPGIQPFAARSCVPATSSRWSASGDGLPEGAALHESVPRWLAFPDAPQALRIPGRHFRLAAPANIDQWGLVQVALTLGSPLDDVVTTEDVGINNSDPQVFAYCLGRQSVRGCSHAGFLHVGQNQYHDIGVAERLGCQAAGSNAAMVVLVSVPPPSSGSHRTQLPLHLTGRARSGDEMRICVIGSGLAGLAEVRTVSAAVCGRGDLCGSNAATSPSSTTGQRSVGLGCSDCTDDCKSGSAA